MFVILCQMVLFSKKGATCDSKYNSQKHVNNSLFLFLWWFHYTGEKFKNPCTRLKLRQLKIFVSSWPIYLNLNLKTTLKRIADNFKHYMQPLKRVHILQRDFFHKLLFVSSKLSLHCFRIPSMLHFTLLSSFICQ